MRTVWKIALGIVAAIVLVVIGLGAGWLVWGRWLWMPGTRWETNPCGVAGSSLGMRSTPWQSGPGIMRGPGMMGNGPAWSAPANCAPGGSSLSTTGSIDIQDARQAVERYIAGLGYGNLKIDEMMEFQQNFYALVRESDTGIGAMELLVDKTTGAVGPEMGPNMMWNARYGMHRQFADGSNGQNSISADKALQLAQEWLDKNRPGVTTEEEADPFYGYYTVHTMQDGKVEGMLSVHGTTGQVWYHTWHGPFVQMIEGDGE